MSEVILYNYFRSSASWRVRIGLHYKQIPFEYRSVNLIADGGEQFGDAHRSRNPMRELPTLAIDGQHISQSLAILEYLEETRPAMSILPAGAHDRAMCRQLSEVINASIQPQQNLRVLKHLETTFGADGAAKIEWARYWIDFGLQGLEPLLARTSGQYSIGDSISIADFCLVPQVYNARRYGVDLAPYCAVARLDAALSSLPFFAASHPDVQPDAPRT